MSNLPAIRRVRNVLALVLDGPDGEFTHILLEREVKLSRYDNRIPAFRIILDPRERPALMEECSERTSTFEVRRGLGR